MTYGEQLKKIPVNENVRLQAAKTWADHLHVCLQATHEFLHLLDICGPREPKSKKLVIFHFCIEGMLIIAVPR